MDERGEGKFNVLEISLIIGPINFAQSGIIKEGPFATPGEGMRVKTAECICVYARAVYIYACVNRISVVNDFVARGCAEKILQSVSSEF